jgi:phage shock protein C
MYCCNCGRKLEDQARFCSECGTPRPNVPPPPSQPYERHPLSRTRDGKIAGVCGGVARYFDIDVSLVRIVWLLAAFFPPAPGLVAYFVCWIVMPEDPPPAPAPPNSTSVPSPVSQHS